MSDEKIALVTGGAQGIGLACAQALQEDGCKILLADINTDQLQQAVEQIGNGCTGFTCDMGDSDAVLSMFDELESSHGAVSVLVNNAGVALPGDFLAYSLG